MDLPKRKYIHIITAAVIYCYLPKHIGGLLEAIPDEALELDRGACHHVLLLLPLHRHRWHCSICKPQFEIEFFSIIPMMFSLKIWLIFGLVETWQSKLPASDAFVNFSFNVFWPRLKVSNGKSFQFFNWFNRVNQPQVVPSSQLKSTKISKKLNITSLKPVQIVGRWYISRCQ